MQAARGPVVTLADKVSFVEELTEDVKRSLLKNIERVPEDWDGIELRQWIADSFADAAPARVMDRSRRRRYHNEVLTRNL